MFARLLVFLLLVPACNVFAPAKPPTGPELIGTTCAQLHSTPTLDLVQDLGITIDELARLQMACLFLEGSPLSDRFVVVTKK